MTYQPEIRPLTALTPAILTNNSHLSVIIGTRMVTRPITDLQFVYDSNGFTLTHAAQCDGKDVQVPYPSTAKCFPCSFNPETGIATPEPWPIGEGEEEIEEWRGMKGTPLPSTGKKWTLYDDYDPEGLIIPAESERDDCRPVMRHGSRWVWEKAKQAGEDDNTPRIMSLGELEHLVLRKKVLGSV